MKDVTQILNEYRECVRNLWNTYFIKHIPSEAEGAWDVFDEYDDICTMLFSSLVLRTLDRETYKKAQAYTRIPEPLFFLRVVPIIETGVPININRDKHSSGYWDYPISIIKSDEVDMRFIDFFDFDLLGFRDFQYCRVRIVGSNLNADLVGRDALLFCNHIKINFDESEQPSTTINKSQS